MYCPLLLVNLICCRKVIKLKCLKSVIHINIFIGLYLQDTRFPKGINHTCDVCSVICIPLLLPEGDLVAISEFHRDGFKDIFSERDFQIANAMLCSILSCLHLSQINKVLETQQELNDFLLETTKQLFDDVISIDSLIQSIMHSTKNLVNAERCALFLIDHQKGELFADFFDEGYDVDGKPVFKKKKQIRLPFDEGIVSKVAKTGVIVNVKDSLKDDRFTKNVDKQTGYTTRNVLCMPIVGKGGVIGVVELINSSAFDHFTKADESAFKMFAVYCALALHYSKLYSMLHLQQDQYEVAMEVLQYHILASEEEIGELMKNPLPTPDQIPPSLYTFDFYGGEYMDSLPKFFLHMIDDLFGVTRFQVKKLVHFILTVRKNYRQVMYHNWKHGFHVAHSLYIMIKTSPEVFTTVESLALVLAGICHDLDHRGFNNAFFEKLHHPLAALYSTNVMEQHHYKQTVLILQSQGHDILSGMSKREYKIILEMIRQAIIATDLALYFGNQKILHGYLNDGVFDIKEPEMRKQALSLMMTGADLCAIAKPWNTQKQTVNEIYEEFYYQGDEEKKQGLVPTAMMDREKKDEIPKQQVGFIKFIGCPLYTTLKQILPSTEKLLQGSL
ncbi:hypothetical protein LOTGIDRAFT_106271 [Lottia gigantea]|uniref:Phosphodiesterase n=1 Tax=Lottia gigantea TaxID=225164 RepID=V3ZY99_LOTGI|nr:hypothetical protein LOTGIDRAFT_106271 [Lottia gigantea]ESO89352.1 hypothetical protein LOTGIDRAFT_106271 [Lottia gigantea]